MLWHVDRQFARSDFQMKHLTRLLKPWKRPSLSSRNKRRALETDSGSRICQTIRSTSTTTNHSLPPTRRNANGVCSEEELWGRQRTPQLASFKSLSRTNSSPSTWRGWVRLEFWRTLKPLKTRTGSLKQASSWSLKKKTATSAAPPTRTEPCCSEAWRARRATKRLRTTSQWPRTTPSATLEKSSSSSKPSTKTNSSKPWTLGF